MLIMKKILFLTPHVPSNRAGGENFTRLLLLALAENNEVDLIYYKYKEDPFYEPSKNIRVLCAKENSTLVKLKNFILYPFVHPLFSVRFDWSLLLFIQKTISANNYDLLYLDHSQMALYGKFFPKIKKIIMSHDVMAQRYSRKGNKLIKRYILRSEGNLIKIPNTIVFSFSEKDKNIIRDVYNCDSKVTNFILENMVIDACPTKISKRIVFMGKWKRADNFDGLKWFFKHCYNSISKGVEIVIIGKWLPEEFLNIINNYGNVKYLGFVENPYKLIADSIAVISPLFSGAGVKVKVVESLACGTPVIGTNIAFEGISKQFESFMFLANTPHDYVKCIENIDISITERINFKTGFIKSYQSETITNYIEQI